MKNGQTYKPVFLGAVVTTIVLFIPIIGILCSCLFGLPGIIGGFVCVKSFLKRDPNISGGRGAWLGLYSAALGSVIALIVFLLMGLFSVDYEHLKPTFERLKDLFIQQGLSPTEAEKKLEELKPVLIAFIRWHPLFILFINSMAGAGIGALTAFMAQSKRRITNRGF